MASNSVETTHPSYIERSPDWITTRDTLQGQRHIKDQGRIYLAPTSAMESAGLGAGQPGFKMYEAYKKRAVFPSLVRPAVNALVGVMHREPATIKLPAAMESLRENATLEGESLQTLLLRINEAQLITGRVGLLADVPTNQDDPVPFITFYEAEAIRNWDESRRPDGRLRPDLVVLDESVHERTSTFGWEFVKKFLVLDLVDRADLQRTEQGEVPDVPSSGAIYRSRLEISDQNVKIGEDVNRQTEVIAQSNDNIQGVTPSLRGRTLDEIPFVFIGSVDLTAEPDQIPMLDLANLALTIYRGEADYRHTLFMQGQDTLVVVGDQPGDPTQTNTRTVGASASLDLQVGGEAYYVGVSSDGLKEQREALVNDRNNASEIGSNLLASSGGGAQEAQETLRIRVAARTASITTIVKAGAAGLQAILRRIAEWKGLNPEEVVVKPNMDFIGDSFLPKDLVDMMTAKNMGAPLSRESIHAWLSAKDVTALTLEEELDLLNEEEPIKVTPDPEDDARAQAEDRAFALAQIQAQGGNGNTPREG